MSVSWGKGLPVPSVRLPWELEKNMVPDNKISILIVDDELSIRESLQGWLKRDGYQVETAAGGPEALAKNAENRFDIMLIDVKMPKMDGLTLLKKI